MIDKARLSNIPEEPGVYLMKDKSGRVIYVGKAKILKNRVRQYFQNQERHAPKVRAMVTNTSDFEYILTDSEMEALILECNLIKKHKPYYNILLKDDKNFPLIRVSVNEDYPKISFTRQMKKDGARYFGPYTSSAAVREAIDAAQKLYKIPSCRIKLPEDMGRKRVCLNYHIGQCIAPCINEISPVNYKKLIHKVCDFFDGKHEEIISELEKEMLICSRNLEFERAASLRDKINGIRAMDEKQKIVSEKQADEDVIAFYREADRAFCVILFIRHGRMLGRHHAILDKTAEFSDEVITADIIKQFYSEASYIPKNIYIGTPCEDIELISTWLSEKKGSKVEIKQPMRGTKRELTLLAHKNARQAAVDYILKKAENKISISKTVMNLKDALGLKTPPMRIEAYDISNISGADSVGSMVVFVGGESAKRYYRMFKIETVTGADDYKSMSEVIYRRLKEAQIEEGLINEGKLIKEDAKFLPLPDCIFLDGGKGHVSVISELFELLDVDIPLFGMVKDDRHRTNALIDSKGREIGLKRQSDIFNLIYAIQEEVHRFAISYHKKLRKKTLTGSVLTEIEGVGNETRKKLLKHFKTMTAIKSASIEELASVKGVTKKAAENIYKFFK
ncbi:MAG: excinuclease ABC subunit UvrC [Clostridia bacterium]|nr:excinuclease ABC subunit UvrC [Clostridia bacterium]